MKRTLILITLLLGLTGLNAGALTIDIYHTSDVHGWYSARPAAWDKENSTRPIGGFPALAALVKKDRNPRILLDSGDMFQGTPEGILTKGMASVKLMNQLGYGAAVPGNHDYDYGEAPLLAMISTATFPFLGANLYYKGTDSNTVYLKPYTIIKKAGKKIAVLGLLGKHTATSTLPSNVRHLDFHDEAAEAAKWLPEIKAAKPDAVIIITHMGLSDELSIKRVDISSLTFATPDWGTLWLARKTKGADLILGGHNHSAFIKGYHDPLSGVWLGESGYGLSYVTRAALRFNDKTGKLAGIKVDNIPLWTDVTGEDPKVLKTVAGFAAEVERAMGRVVGTAATDLNFSPEGLDSGIGDWGCDLTREAAGTDLAFQNTKGIRAEIKKGAVRLRDLYQAVPFDNTVVTMRLNGAQLKRIMADNISNGKTFMQVSGLEVEFRQGLGRGPAEIRLIRNGAEIRPEEEFTVATNNYLAGGGDGGAVFNEGKDITDTLLPVRDLMIKAFADGPVSAPATGRIRRLN